jgi:hypothetical protein
MLPSQRASKSGRSAPAMIGVGRTPILCPSAHFAPPEYRPTAAHRTPRHAIPGHRLCVRGAEGATGSVYAGLSVWLDCNEWGTENRAPDWAWARVVPVGAERSRMRRDERAQVGSAGWVATGPFLKRFRFTSAKLDRMTKRLILRVGCGLTRGAIGELRCLAISKPAQSQDVRRNTSR